MATQRQTVVWVSAAGDSRTTQLTTSADAAPLRAAIAGHSNAAISLRWAGDLVVVGSPTPVAATYISARDAARLVYQTAAGAQISVTIPAPAAAIFMADGQTVDPAAVADVTAQAIALLVGQSGDPATALVAGFREASP